MRITNRPEKILNLLMSIFSIVYSIICTGYIFTKYTDMQRQQRLTLNSIDDLNTSKLEIFVGRQYFSEELRMHLSGL